MSETNDRPSLMSRLDPRPMGWAKVAVLAILVAGTLGAEVLEATHTAGVLLGLCGLSLGVNGIRGKRASP